MKKKETQRKYSWILFVPLLSLVISGCGSVPDEYFCTDLRPGAGFCVSSISNKEIIVDDKNLFPTKDGRLLTWYDMQTGIIKIPLETFKAVKKYIINQCKKTGSCKENIESWDRALTTLETKATEK